MKSITKVHKNLSLENIKGEIWKDIPDYEGYYQVSNYGRVKSLSRYQSRKERILKQQISPEGYLSVGLQVFKKNKRFQTHQLVAITFLNHKPCGHKRIVDHKDNISLNNRSDNLQIISNRENSSKDKKHIEKKTSKYVGVSWKTSRNKWRSVIYHNKKETHLGFFTSEEEAHKQYQKALEAIEKGEPIPIKRRTPTSKYRGVHKKGNKWVVELKRKRYGSFDTEEEAVKKLSEVNNIPLP